MKFRQLPLVQALAAALGLILAGCGGGGGGDATDATSVVPAPEATLCPAQTLTWTASGNSCSGAGAETASGSNAVVTNTAANFAGTASFACTAGAWQAPANAGCAAVAPPPPTPEPTPAPTPAPTPQPTPEPTPAPTPAPTAPPADDKKKS